MSCTKSVEAASEKSSSTSINEAVKKLSVANSQASLSNASKVTTTRTGQLTPETEGDTSKLGLSSFQRASSVMDLAFHTRSMIDDCLEEIENAAPSPVRSSGMGTPDLMSEVATIEELQDGMAENEVDDISIEPRNCDAATRRIEYKEFQLHQLSN